MPFSWGSPPEPADVPPARRSTVAPSYARGVWNARGDRDVAPPGGPARAELPSAGTTSDPLPGKPAQARDTSVSTVALPTRSARGRPSSVRMRRPRAGCLPGTVVVSAGRGSAKSPSRPLPARGSARHTAGVVRRRVRPGGTPRGFGPFPTPRPPAAVHCPPPGGVAPPPRRPVTGRRGGSARPDAGGRTRLFHPLRCGRQAWRGEPRRGVRRDGPTGSRGFPTGFREAAPRSWERPPESWGTLVARREHAPTPAAVCGSAAGRSCRTPAARRRSSAVRPRFVAPPATFPRRARDGPRRPPPEPARRQLRRQWP